MKNSRGGPRPIVIIMNVIWAMLSALVVLFVVAFVAMKFFKVSPILLLLLAGIFGGVFYGLIG